MRIDWTSRRTKIIGSAVAFVALVAWLVPPTTPQPAMRSPLLAYKSIDPHRDDAAAYRTRTTVYTPATWQKWFASQATGSHSGDIIPVVERAPVSVVAPVRQQRVEVRSERPRHRWEDEEDAPPPQRWAERAREERWARAEEWRREREEIAWERARAREERMRREEDDAYYREAMAAEDDSY